MEGQNIALVGWSRVRDRMFGNVWQWHPGDVGFRTTQDGGPYCLSPEDIGEQPSPPDTREKMERFARAQTRIWKAKDPDLAIGGRLIVAELTQHSMTITQGCELDSAQQQTPVWRPAFRL